MVDDRGADRDAAVDRGGGGRRDTGLLQRNRDLRVEPVCIRAPISKADDVELHRRQELELGRRLDPALEILRELAAVRDRATDPLGAVGLEGEPGLERAESTREIRTEIAEPRRARV